MKKTIALIFALLTSSIAYASQSFGPAFDFSKSSSVTVAEVLTKPSAYLQQPFTVQGKIDAVCQKKGCWMQFATAADQPTFRLKVKDGDIVFPISAKGKMAYAHGSLKAKPMTLDQTKTYLKHRAEEQGEAFDANAVHTAITLYQFEPVSVLIE
ncbi:MAG: DUF4920 domain-containing protein [Rheinheimera sp.]|nr:DUF4920 domain-containing protein [Rheinheimera sp.]